MGWKAARSELSRVANPSDCLPAAAWQSGAAVQRCHSFSRCVAKWRCHSFNRELHSTPATQFTLELFAKHSTQCSSARFSQQPRSAAVARPTLGCARPTLSSRSYWHTELGNGHDDRRRRRCWRRCQQQRLLLLLLLLQLPNVGQKFVIYLKIRNNLVFIACAQINANFMQLPRSSSSSSSSSPRRSCCCAGCRVLCPMSVPVPDLRQCRPRIGVRLRQIHLDVAAALAFSFCHTHVHSAKMGSTFLVLKASNKKLLEIDIDRFLMRKTFLFFKCSQQNLTYASSIWAKSSPYRSTTYILRLYGKNRS